MAYTSHYKIVSTSLLAIILLIFLSSPVIQAKNKYVITSLAACLLLFGFTYYKNIPNARWFYDIRVHGMSKWLTNGEHSALGLSAWYHYSDKILFKALESEIYLPFKDTDALKYRPSSITAISSCPGSPKEPPFQHVAIHEVTLPAAKITFIDPKQAIDEIFLCSKEQTYKITLGNKHLVSKKQSKYKVIIDIQEITPGSYQTYFKNDAGGYLKGKKLLVSAPRYDYICDHELSYHIPETFKEREDITMDLSGRKKIGNNICSNKAY